jgi:hypothetical protein
MQWLQTQWLQTHWMLPQHFQAQAQQHHEQDSLE